MTEPPIPPRIAEQVTKNLGLARQFLTELVDDPGRLESIPESTRIVLFPSNDDELARTNFEFAVRELFRGHAVALQRVGDPIPEAEEWRAVDRRRALMHEVRFPTSNLLAGDVKIIYDQDRDTLLVDYFNGQRANALWLQINPQIILRVDSDSHEITGYLIASYLQTEAPNSPVIIRALRKAAFRSISDDELGDVTIERHGETPFDDDEAAAVASEFIRWISPRGEDRSNRTRESA